MFLDILIRVMRQHARRRRERSRSGTQSQNTSVESRLTVRDSTSENLVRQDEFHVKVQLGGLLAHEHGEEFSRRPVPA